FQREHAGIAAEELLHDDVRIRHLAKQLLVPGSFDDPDLEIEASDELLELPLDDVGPLGGPPTRRMEHDGPTPVRQWRQSVPGEVETLRKVRGVGDVDLIQDG